MQIENAYRDSVRERDLDNFLVEELSASFEFREWIIGKLTAGFSAPAKGEVRVFKSPPRESNDGRQTDVQIGWFFGETLRACVLLESKVTDGFHLGQTESYAGEVSALRSRLGGRQAAAILVAPASKLARLPHEGAFEAEVAIEEIVAFLETRLASLEDGELARRIMVRVELLEALCGNGSPVAGLRTPSERRGILPGPTHTLRRRYCRISWCGHRRMVPTPSRAYLRGLRSKTFPTSGYDTNSGAARRRSMPTSSFLGAPTTGTAYATAAC